MIIFVLAWFQVRLPVLLETLLMSLRVACKINLVATLKESNGFGLLWGGFLGRRGFRLFIRDWFQDLLDLELGED